MATNAMYQSLLLGDTGQSLPLNFRRFLNLTFGFLNLGSPFGQFATSFDMRQRVLIRSKTCQISLCSGIAIHQQ